MDLRTNNNLSNQLEIGATKIKADYENDIKTNKKPKLNCQEESKTRIGVDYQAICPSLIPEAERDLAALNERALTIWRPTEKLQDVEIQDYLALASEKYGYNNEQALGMLQWHEHNIEQAIVDLAHFIPYAVEWTPEDNKIFEDALLFHGKNFVRISRLVPNKTLSDIIHHYYATRKKGRRQRHTRKNMI